MNPSLVVLILLSGNAVFGARSTEFFSSFRLTASNHLIVSNAKDPNDSSTPSTTILMHAAKVGAEYDPYALGITFSNLFGSHTTGKEKSLAIEKKTIGAQWEEWELLVGDSHQEFGRGIALSLHSDPVFGIDNTLEGISVNYHPEKLNARLIGGRIHSLSNPVAINAVGNPLLNRTLWLGGAQINDEVASGHTPGLHYVAALNQPTGEKDFNRVWHTLGATYSASIGKEVDAEFESNLLYWQRLRSFGYEKMPLGMGSFASLAWTESPWKLKGELKDYRGYHFEFRRPPTLEEDIVETANTEEVSAFRLRVERRLEYFTLQPSYLIGKDRKENADIHHGVAGIKFKAYGKSEVEIRGGYRSLPGKNNLAHISLKGKTPTFRAQSLEIQVRKQVGRKYPGPQFDDKNLFDLTYSFSEKFNASLGYEYVPSNDPTTGRNFASISALLNLGSFRAKALVGQTSGGTLCSGGICRQVPPYSGAYLESTAQF